MPSTFKFRAYLRLKKELGVFDSYSECIELAMRQFIDSASKSGSPNDYLQQQAQTFGIRVNKLDAVSLPVHVRQFFLVTVHQQFEKFLSDFGKEVGKTWEKGSKESLLACVLRSLGPRIVDPKTKVGELPINVVEYYRKVRNKFSHHKADMEGASKTLPALRASVSASIYSKLDAPNLYDALSFDDFVLFSRAVKDVALGISNVRQPSPEDIANMLAAVEDEESGFTFHSLKRIKKSKRIKAAILTSLHRLYGMSDSEGSPVADILLKGPLA